MKMNSCKIIARFVGSVILTALMLLSGTGYAQNTWNLKLKEQAGFTGANAEKLLKPVYDTTDLRYDPGSDVLGDSMELTFEPLYFFEAAGVVYALQVIENQGPGYGVSIGWCDLALFKKEQGAWKLTDVLLHAGGGGMYGNSGHFQGMIKVGKNAGGIVLSGGQTHMGDLFHDDILLLKEGKFSSLVMIYTHHSYGDWEDNKEGYQVCEDNDYQFLESDQEIYDLRIIRKNCLGKDVKEVERVTIPYKSGYAIPAGFVFES